MRRAGAIDKSGRRTPRRGSAAEPPAASSRGRRHRRGRDAARRARASITPEIPCWRRRTSSSPPRSPGFARCRSLEGAGAEAEPRIVVTLSSHAGRRAGSTMAPEDHFIADHRPDRRQPGQIDRAGSRPGRKIDAARRQLLQRQDRRERHVTGRTAPGDICRTRRRSRRLNRSRRGCSRADDRLWRRVAEQTPVMTRPSCGASEAIASRCTRRD